MDPGSSVNIDGSFLQPNPYTVQMEARASFTNEEWGDEIGGSKKPIAITKNLGSMMMKDCYKNPSGKVGQII